jgi:hypothetical protein
MARTNEGLWLNDKIGVIGMSDVNPLLQKKPVNPTPPGQPVMRSAMQGMGCAIKPGKAALPALPMLGQR